MAWSNSTLSNTGLTGTIYNTNPPLLSEPAAVYTGSCTKIRFSGGCDPSTFQCPNCPPSQIGQECSCTLAQNPYYCDPSGASCNYNYTCTRPCIGIDTTKSCPGGTYQSASTQNGKLAAICSYSISEQNYQDYVQGVYNLPETFNQGLINRYVVSKYIQLWNDQLYKDPKSIYHQTVSNTATRAHLKTQMGRYGVSDAFISMLEEMTLYPQPIITGSQYNLQIAVYGTYIPDPPSASDVTSYIRSFTGETTQSPYNPSLGAGVPDTNNYIIVDFTTNKVYTSSTPSPSGLGDPFVVGKVYVAQVTNLSPVVMYLFDHVYHLTYDTIGNKGLCDMIISQTGQIPNICYNNTCQVTNPPASTCKGLIEQYCGGGKDPKTTSGISYDLDQYYVTSNSSDCTCYNTQLPPPINRDQTRFAGMCFTNSCTLGQSSGSMMNVFGLTDQACSQNCQEVYNWVTNADPAKRTYMNSYMDTGRFQRLCGEVKPSVKTPINYWVLGIGIAITIGSIIGMYLWKGSWLYTGIIGLLLGAITAFLCFDLNGVPYCDGENPGCKSSISKIQIPNLFCSYHLGCECNLINRPCPTGKECIAGICITPSEPGAVKSGCTECTTPGLFWCPAGVIKYPGSPYDGKAAQISSYRVPQYDPVNPPITLNGDGYYWRQISTGC